MQKHSKLVLIGAGGHSKVCHDIAIKLGTWDEIIILDDNLENDFFKVSGKISDMKYYLEDADYFVAIGNNKMREQIATQLESLEASIVSLVHPYAVIALDVEVSKGTVVIGGAVINSGSKLGKFNVINTGSTVGHDVILGDFVHISPGTNIAGTVNIGSHSWIGVGSAIINNISICADAYVGGGSVVIKDIEEPGTYVGNPVRKIR